MKAALGKLSSLGQMIKKQFWFTDNYKNSITECPGTNKQYCGVDDRPILELLSMR